MLDDLVSYSVLWVVAAALVTESRRTLAVVAAVPAVQVVSFNVASVTGGLVGLGVVVGGYGVVAYLFFGPIWDRVGEVAEERRLLHWKARNPLLFLTGMLIVFALLTVAGTFDPFVSAVLAEYLGALLRVGFAGFLFANHDALGEGANDGGPAASAAPDGEAARTTESPAGETAA